MIPGQLNVGDSFEQGLDRFFAYLPNVLAFVVILLIGFIVAKIAAVVVRKLLEKLGLDRKLQESDASKYVGNSSPSGMITTVAFWIIFAFFLVPAIAALQIPALTTFMYQVLAYLPNIIVAIVIFVVAAIIAGAVAAGVTRVMGDTPTGKIVATVVPALVMVIAVFMILTQLKIAEEIVVIAFAAIMGALALGLALAFGLGGRPLAQSLLEDAQVKGREYKDQAKQDAQTGKERAQQQGQEARAQAEARGSGSSSDQYGSTSTSA